MAGHLACSQVEAKIFGVAAGTLSEKSPPRRTSLADGSADPGEVSQESTLFAGEQRRARNLKPRSLREGNESPVLAPEEREGCKTDPEPDMDGGQAGVRNMRSKCRCSYVLQFTFRRAVSCVLHRPPSQVIHCAVLSLQTKAIVATSAS